MTLLHLLKENTGFRGPAVGTAPAFTSPQGQQEADSVLGVPLPTALLKLTGIMHHTVSRNSLWPSRVTESCCTYSVVEGCVTGTAGPPTAHPPCLLPSCRAFSAPCLPTGVSNCPAPPGQGYLTPAPPGKPGATSTSQGQKHCWPQFVLGSDWFWGCVPARFTFSEELSTLAWVISLHYLL